MSNVVIYYVHRKTMIKACEEAEKIENRGDKVISISFDASQGSYLVVYRCQGKDDDWTK